jgi:predicted 2-oxoglutarate/Fe(II)-dependent dioxygenase YbiX
MKAFVFAGPTLAPDEGLQALGITFLPPVSQGDVYRLTNQAPDAIAIVDGYFERVPAVWHKEILWAMSQGIHVYGSSSMGALRAAELHAFGMIGVGKIFDDFRRGLRKSDDDVALLHGPAEKGYAPTTEALVNIDATVDRARAERVIRPETAEAIRACARQLFYKDRTYDHILFCVRDRVPDAARQEELHSFEQWVVDGRVDQKRIDAVEMLEQILADFRDGVAPKQVAYHFEYTSFWDDFWRSSVSSDRKAPAAYDGVLVDDVIEELIVTGMAPHAQTGAMMRHLAIREARSKVEITDQQLEQTARDFRLARDLDALDDVDQWLLRNQLTRAGFLRFLEKEAFVRWVKSMFRSDSYSALVDHLRSTGEFEALAARVRDKRRVVGASGVEACGLEALGLTEEELLRWHFAERQRRTVPKNLDAYLKENGVASVQEFVRMLVRERQYVDRLQDVAPDRGGPSAKLTTSIQAGDPAPEFTLSHRDLGTVSLAQLAGRPTLLLFAVEFPDQTTLDALATIGADVHVVVILRQSWSAQIVPDHVLVLTDTDGVAFGRYGIDRDGLFLLDAGHRVVELRRHSERLSSAAIERSVNRLNQNRARTVPPILVVPGVLSPELCARLIDCWRGGDRQAARVTRLTASGLTDTYDPDIKRRRDHTLRGELAGQAEECIVGRLRKELVRAFHFEIGRCEQLRIGCYDADEKGYFRAHRDNGSVATAGRRYSVSINLNCGEFEGGELWFPEYGEQKYCVETGSALVFSSALLHEVTAVRAGARFALITFLYGP